MSKNIQFAKGRYSPRQVLEAANAYYRLSEVIADTIPPTIGELQDGYDMGDLVASATNRVLALELYLKALLIGTDTPVPMVHNLVILFEALSAETKSRITSAFDHLAKEEDLVGKGIAIVVCFQLDAAVDDDDVTSAREKFVVLPSLISLLERNSDLFIESRYLFQRATFTEVTCFQYEYRRLEIICALLKQTLELNLEPKLFS